MEQQQSIDSSQPNFVMPNDWHGRIIDATFLVRHVAHNVRLIGWNEHDANRLIYCVADENGKVFWAGDIKFVDTETETETVTETTIETETMDSNSPTGPLRIMDRHGRTIPQNAIGYRQVLELGQYLAELWPVMATVKLSDKFATAYDYDGIYHDSMTFEGLPKELRGSIRYLTLDGVEMEFIEF